MRVMPALFVVPSQRPEMDAPVEEAIKATFLGNFFALGRAQWLVAGEGTAREISDKLGVTGIEPPPIGSSIVFATLGYCGRASSEVWDWIAAKLGGHMSPRQSGQTGSGGEQLPKFSETTTPRSLGTGSDYSQFTFQVAMDLQKSVGQMTTAVATLTEHSKEQGKKLDRLRPCDLCGERSCHSVRGNSLVFAQFWFLLIRELIS
jgi:hypothetical protein